MATKVHAEALEVGVMRPRMFETGSLSAGEIGYLVTGLKDISGCRVGDTVTLADADVEMLPGYRGQANGLCRNFCQRRFKLRTFARSHVEVEIIRRVFNVRTGALDRVGFWIRSACSDYCILKLFKSACAANTI